MNSDIFKKGQLHQKTLATMPTLTFHLPKGNIDLAYVNTGDGPTSIEPFVLFYLRHFIDDVLNESDLTNSLAELCDKKQLKNLKDQVTRLLLADWPGLVTSHPVHIQKRILLSFNRHFENHFPILLSMLKMSDLTDEEKRAFLAEIQLKEKIRFNADLDHVLAYLEFFTPESWEDILVEFQGVEVVNQVIELLSTCDRLNFLNLKLLVRLFANQGDGTVVPVDYLTQLFADFGETGLRDYLVDALSAAKQHAEHLAKAIFLVKDAQLINEEIMQFLNDHPANADYLAEVLILFNKGAKTTLDSELFSFLKQHETQSRKFVDCTHDPSLLAWVKYFIDLEWLTTDRLKLLYLKADFIHEMLGMMGALWLLDSNLLATQFDLLLNETKKLNQVNFIKYVANYCQNKKITFNPMWLQTILSAEQEYPLVLDDAMLATYATTFKMTEILESYTPAVATHLTRLGQFAQPALEDHVDPVVPPQPRLDE